MVDSTGLHIASSLTMVFWSSLCWAFNVFDKDRDSDGDLSAPELRWCINGLGSSLTDAMKIS